METLRVLLVAEKTQDGFQKVAVCLEKAVAGQGRDDLQALESLALCLLGHQKLGDFDKLPPSPEKHHTAFANATRASTTMREGFVFQVRSP